MNPKIKKSKFNTKITAIIAGIIILGLILPTFAQASFLNIIKMFSGGPEGIAEAILTLTSYFIHILLNWLVKAGAAFFEGMLNIGFKGYLDIIQIGWKVTRDFSNMFFILFMVIIAFATILRIEQYGIRQLLPKVILIALLINFSLVICSVIIDFSNIAGNFFIKDIREKLRSDKPGAISASFVDSLNLTGTQMTFTNCDAYNNFGRTACDNYFSSGTIERQNCYGVVDKNTEECRTQGKITVSTEGSVLAAFLSLTVGSLVLLIAAFAFFAGGLLLLIRIVFIWFLVMLVPLVFLCYIMPALRRLWQKWWTTFLSWCFFAPAYGFFIWMAFQLAVTSANKKLGGAVINSPTGDWGALSNVFVALPGEQLISYMFMIAFLIGGLIAAKQFGIYGASTIMAVGQKWGRAAASRISRYPRELGAAIAGGAVQQMGKGFQKIPGLRGFGERMEARGKIIAQKPLAAAEIKKAEEMFKQMSPEQLAHQIKTQISGAMTYAAAKVAYERDDFTKNKDKRAADIAAKTFRAFGDIKKAEEIEKSRADTIEDDRKQFETLKGMKDKGELNKLSAIALEDERVVSKLVMLGVNLEKLREISDKHGDNLKTTLANITNPANQTRMIAMGINPLAKEIQHAYAAQTGNIGRMTPAQRAFFARDAGPEGLKRITSVTPDMVKAIPASKLKVIIDKMESDIVAKEIIRQIKANPTHPAYQVVIRDRYLNNLVK